MDKKINLKSFFRIPGHKKSGTEKVPDVIENIRNEKPGSYLMVMRLGSRYSSPSSVIIQNLFLVSVTKTSLSVE